MPDRLHVAPLKQPFHIALVDPEIPQNTGNIGRICVGTGSPLHLIGKLGFSIDEKAVRRAGLDYWHHVELRRHLDIEHFRHQMPDTNWKLFSSFGQKSYLETEYKPGDVLIFGKESTGLDMDLLERYEDRVYGIPMPGPIRSLNVANAVGIVLFEALRQIGALTVQR